MNRDRPLLLLLRSLGTLIVLGAATGWLWAKSLKPSIKLQRQIDHEYEQLDQLERKLVSARAGVPPHFKSIEEQIEQWSPSNVSLHQHRSELLESAAQFGLIVEELTFLEKAQVLFPEKEGRSPKPTVDPLPEERAGTGFPASPKSGNEYWGWQAQIRGQGDWEPIVRWLNQIKSQTSFLVIHRCQLQTVAAKSEEGEPTASLSFNIGLTYVFRPPTDAIKPTATSRGPS